MEKLPKHLQKYIVDQNYERYTPVNQATWRYILRQLKSYLGTHAHQSYLDGLEKTGISTEKIPRISEISEKISAFGWRALPVSGFIPPAAFMELQALGVLPIACDMRSTDHLEYTPAPDIVHEAAGHAPILSHPQFSQYLRDYAQVAKKAIISSEDLALYEAIRDLSDIKERADSTAEEIQKAQEKLDQAANSVTHISEASELARMNWWTAEYGLVGDLANPKIFGAGLLSSVGESKWCLSEKVQKIPLTLDCIKQNYDITEPQPQLFVTPDFATLSRVLLEFSETMAFKVGGIIGLEKALKAKTVNTVQLDSGVQISGVLKEYQTKDSKIGYLQFSGPTQISLEDSELPGHGRTYHSEGFGTAVGDLKNKPGVSLSDFQLQDWTSVGCEMNQPCLLQFTSGVEVKGVLTGLLQVNGRNLIASFNNCTVTLNGHILFQPEWGTYDMALGQSVVSVFGGPADRIAYGETEDFPAKRIPAPHYSAKERQQFMSYQRLREIRESELRGDEMMRILGPLFTSHEIEFPNDWLWFLEAYELTSSRAPQAATNTKIHDHLIKLMKTNPTKAGPIRDGLILCENSR